MNFYKNYMKRFLDILISLFALIVLSPILIMVSILVYIKLGSPIIFKQSRPGKNEEIFKMYKFRSMTDKRDENGELLPDSVRLTKFGKLLRSTSLDELPELLNILKGEMSFVGPRPLSMLYLPFYNANERRRHEVAPGLTGLSQISGRNNLAWDKRMALDEKYVDNLTFMNDIKILLKTIEKVLSRSDIGVRSDNPIKNFNVYRKVQSEDNKMNKYQGLEQLEIGSDFEYSKPLLGEGPSVYNHLENTLNDDFQFTFSGRSAIGKIIDDILSTRTIRTAYLPSYACLSMVLPFINRDIDVEFYDVDFKEGELKVKIDFSKTFDVFFFMQYFGYNTNEDAYREAVKYSRKNNITVIEDITHSLLNENCFKFEADYSLASLRKWFAIPSGGIAYKKEGEFVKKATLDSDMAAKEKLEAMKLKKQYLTNKIDEKETYLKMMGNYGNGINRFNSNFTIDSFSLDYLKSTSLKSIKEQRKNNTKYFQEHFRPSQNVQFLFKPSNLKEETPLFVPLVVLNNKRDDLRKYLVDHQVYLPVHWPEKLGQNVYLKEIELSLVIDQRYDEEDMEHIINLINEWTSEQ